jgi:hypothetical protein
MARHGAIVALELPWVETCATRPCPCCGSTAGCAVLDDGEFVHCRTVVSRWPVAAGGWLHRAAELRSPPR